MAPTATSTVQSPLAMDANSGAPSSLPTASPSSAAILAAAKQRRMLLQAAQDPSLLDEFGPLGAPSPTKDATRSRRRVVSEAASGALRQSLADPAPRNGDTLQSNQPTQSRFQDYYNGHDSAHQAPVKENGSLPFTQQQQQSQSWEQKEWGRTASSPAARGMVSADSSAARAGPSQHARTTGDRDKTGPERHQQSQGARSQRQEPQKTFRQIGTASSPSLRRNANDTSFLSPSAHSSAQSSVQPDPSSSSGVYLNPPAFVVSSISSSEDSSETSSPAMLKPPTFDSRTPQHSTAGGRSVSAPYVTHDFDEMLPPAIARRLEQQRLMAMDPRLSRVEGLIDTWDRNGLPLSTRDLWQQQQREKEEEARKQKELEREREDQERARAEEQAQADAKARQQREAATLGGNARDKTDDRVAQMRRQQILAQRALQQQVQHGQEEDDSRFLAGGGGHDDGRGGGLDRTNRRGDRPEPERHHLQPLDPNVRRQPSSAPMGSEGQQHRPTQLEKKRAGSKKQNKDKVDSGCGCIVM